MLTIILTYSDESACIKQWVEVINNVCLRDNDIKIIIVDDASNEAPAIAFMDTLAVPDNLSLYRMRYMVGYNMYGCRNLAMEKTETEWNLLCSMTSIIQPDDIIKIKNMIVNSEVDPNAVYDFVECPLEKNIWLITKDNFWEAKGYDSEWVGCRGGQVTTIERLLSFCTQDTLPYHLIRIAPIANDQSDDRIDRIYSLDVYDNENAKKLVRKAIQERLASDHPMPKQNVEWSKQL